MTTGNLAPGQTGGHSIGFEPHEPYASSEVMILKGCGLCLKLFLTLAVAPMQDCAECRERTAKREAEWATPVAVNASPHERALAAWQTRRAAHALTMKEPA